MQQRAHDHGHSSSPTHNSVGTNLAVAAVESARTRIAQAHDAARRRDPATAERRATEAEALLDARPGAWAELDDAATGQLFELLATSARQRSDAERLLEIAIKMHRYNPPSLPTSAYQSHLRLLAYIELEQGNLTAAAQYRAAFDWRSPAGSPSDTVSASLLSRLLAAEGDYAAAIEAADLAVQLAADADDARALETYRASIPPALCRASRASDVGAAIEAIIERGHQPESIDHIVLGAVCVARGDHDAANGHMLEAKGFHNPPYTARVKQALTYCGRRCSPTAGGGRRQSESSPTPTAP
ncbi:MAG: hypothetical protein R2706_13760 [Acidimicrobiales bacterium]